jgi:RNA polymerase sigma-70 factor (ECF subfamily)
MEDRLAELVAEARLGRREALRGLYDECHVMIHRLLVRMAGAQEASDLTQQVFLRAFQHLDQFSGRSSFQTWLYRLAVNEALQHQRRKVSKKCHSLEHEPVACAAEHTQRTEHKELLEQALAMIDPELRTVFLLREMEELSYEEIAHVIGIPAGTVGSRLNHARKELREHLTRLGWEP